MVTVDSFIFSRVPIFCDLKKLAFDSAVLPKSAYIPIEKLEFSSWVTCIFHKNWYQTNNEFTVLLDNLHTSILQKTKSLHFHDWSMIYKSLKLFTCLNSIMDNSLTNAIDIPVCYWIQKLRKCDLIAHLLNNFYHDYLVHLLLYSWSVSLCVFWCFFGVFFISIDFLPCLLFKIAVVLMYTPNNSYICIKHWC